MYYFYPNSLYHMDLFRLHRFSSSYFIKIFMKRVKFKHFETIGVKLNTCKTMVIEMEHW